MPNLPSFTLFTKPTSHSPSDLQFEMYRLAAQAVHRNRESSPHGRACFDIADFTEMVYKSVAYRLSGRACRFPFLVMSLSGSHVKQCSV
jgi:hypothetical protein